MENFQTQLRLLFLREKLDIIIIYIQDIFKKYIIIIISFLKPFKKYFHK